MGAARASAYTFGVRLPAARHFLSLFAIMVVWAVFRPAPAAACSTCTVGDPTLVAMGLEQPFQHRVRLGATWRFRMESVAEGTAWERALQEHRFELAASYAPHERVVIAAMLPLVYLRADEANLATQRRFGLGDLDLRVRVVLLRDRKLSPRHLISGAIGAELPTSIELRDESREANVDFELQAGSGSFTPLAGLGYGYFADPWSFQFFSVVRVPAHEGHAQTRLGASWSTMAALQYQPWTFLGFRLGLDSRFDAQGTVAGQPDPESGGAILYAGAGLMASPWEDALLRVQASYPFWQDLRGDHREGVALMLSFTHDL